MRPTRGHAIGVDSLAELEQRLAAGACALAGWRISGIDLRGHSAVLAGCDVAGALFLGCTFADGDEERVRRRGGLVLPRVPGLPVDPYRGRLYGPDELFDTPAYEDSLDARTYAWFRADTDPDALLGRSLHDHAIDRALADWTAGRSLVGVMGGHALERDTAGYAAAARLGRALGSSYVVATGGGPGAMEAANLGAFLAGEPAEALDEALAALAPVPSFRPDVTAWAATAQRVRAGVGTGNDSLGIPTWHYGHEPPNLFATGVAKYFHNATREAILLEVCDRGIIFLPGAAGTVQEVFQDACENYYADESATATMILVGTEYWTETLPAWPLLRALAAGRPMAPHVHLAATVEDAVELVLAAG